MQREKLAERGRGAGGGPPPPFSCLENKKEIDGYGGNSCWK